VQVYCISICNPVILKEILLKQFKTDKYGLNINFEKGLKLMENFMWLPAITAIESLLRVFVYITIIIVGSKIIQALNIYNNRNSK